MVLMERTAMIERAFYTIAEFCERNAISRPTFYRRVPQDQLVKIGRRTLVPAATVLPTSLPTKKREIAGDSQRRQETRNGIKPLQDRQK